MVSSGGLSVVPEHEEVRTQALSTDSLNLPDARTKVLKCIASAIGLDPISFTLTRSLEEIDLGTLPQVCF